MNTRWMFATALVGTALLVGACGDDDDDDSGAFPRGDAASQAAAATPGVPSSGGAAPVAGATGDEPLPAQIDPARKIIFTANLALDADNVGRAFTDASALAAANGGYLEKSQLANDKEDNTRRSASLTIRVPVQNYNSLIASLRTLAGVTVNTEGSTSSEVTEQYTDLQSRQRNLERTEEQYLILLNRATSIQEILTVQDRFSGVRSQIEQIQGRLKVLDDLTEFATVNVTIAPVVLAVQESKDNGWKLSQVFAESWQGSFEFARYVAAAGVVALVASPWLLVPGALAYFGSRRFRRKTPAVGQDTTPA